jgi:hypothetical protein
VEVSLGDQKISYLPKPFAGNEIEAQKLFFVLNSGSPSKIPALGVGPNSAPLDPFFQQWFPALRSGDCGDRSRTRCERSVVPSCTNLYLILYYVVSRRRFFRLILRVGPAALACEVLVPHTGALVKRS